MMKVFRFCIYTLIFSLSACTDTAKTSPETHVAPHIVILIADDLGLKRAPCYAQNSPMRFLSRQCDKAVVFERAYTHPYCTASRAAMMTARHTFRHGAGDVRAEATKLPLTETTLPEALKQGGAKNYRFSAFGKWHLADDGNGDVNNPNLQGFDNFEGNPRQHHTYSYFNYDWYKNGTFVGNIPTYKTTKITDTIIDDFKSHAGQGPQFYWTGFVSPHMPYHTPPENLHHHTELPKGFIWQPVRKRPPNTDEFTINKRDPRLDPYFMAMLEALDHEIERLVTHLSAQSDRPIVFVFLGDNGTSAEVYPGDRSIGYRAKTQLYDGGTRIPFMIWSTDNQAVGFRRGRVKAMVHLVDLLPTIADITHAKPIYPKAIDGQSFYKVLTSSIEPTQHTRDYIYLELGNLAKLPFSYGAVNRDGLKLILREKQ
ncbi:MAG TPA: hypothetical protein ENJ42_09520, partial [Hellea balneolensis]|nr:hypothetical protein [Hellea balneolensis]